MKTVKLIAIILSSSLLAASCKKDDDTPEPTVYYQIQDQKGRPAVNTVFNAPGADKDAFNITAPSAMGAIFQPKFLTNLVALDGFLKSKNPAYVNYTVNALGMSPTLLTTTLATDVLNVSMTGATNLGSLSGRGLGSDPLDDVIDVELKFLIFGGPTGNSNPQLISDNVNNNDRPFLASFPYLASPF